MCHCVESKHYMLCHPAMRWCVRLMLVLWSESRAHSFLATTSGWTIWHQALDVEHFFPHKGPNIWRLSKIRSSIAHDVGVNSFRTTGTPPRYGTVLRALEDIVEDYRSGLTHTFPPPVGHAGRRSLRVIDKYFWYCRHFINLVFLLSQRAHGTLLFCAVDLSGCAIFIGKITNKVRASKE